jgi:hypothetical protein
MNAPVAGPVPISTTGKQVLLKNLFPDDGETHTYAILDGASIPDLLDKLYADPRPEFVCLYRGELEPDMAEVAPYLVRLKPDEPFAKWVTAEGWGRHWGIFALSKADLKTVRKHFRTFLMVKDPDGKKLYFRYYDPRVFRVYLPTCNKAETATVFGPVGHYIFEDENPGKLLRFWPDQAPPRRETQPLDPV